MLELRTRHSMAEVGESAWGTLTSDDTPPFLSFAFLDALERTGCVAEGRGWTPCHLTLHDEHGLVAGAPAYLKENSEGEFVFDQGWAKFAEERLGVRYYPKLVLGVPFTPATGPRILLRKGADAGAVLLALGRQMDELVQKLRVSSAHVLFPGQEQAAPLASSGLAHRYGLQYHWHNAGYVTFEDFLSRFNSKRRNQIRREVRAPREQGLDVEVVPGRDLTPELVDAAYDFYVTTVDKYFWGRRYLNRSFFEEVCARVPDGVLLVVARERGNRRPVGGAFNLISRSAMYGRYWGAREDRAFLHFNVCYYRGIAECIERKLSLFEPGAGGEHKLSRGFEPAVTHSLHHLRDPRLDAAVRDFVERERAAVLDHVRGYESDPVLKRG